MKGGGGTYKLSLQCTLLFIINRLQTNATVYLTFDNRLKVLTTLPGSKPVLCCILLLIIKRLKVFATLYLTFLNKQADIFYYTVPYIAL